MSVNLCLWTDFGFITAYARNQRNQIDIYIPKRDELIKQSQNSKSKNNRGRGEAAGMSYKEISVGCFIWSFDG